MQDERQKILTPEFWQREKVISEDLRNGILEQLHGTVYNKTREEALKTLAEMEAKNKTNKN